MAACLSQPCMLENPWARKEYGVTNTSDTVWTNCSVYFCSEIQKNTQLLYSTLARWLAHTDLYIPVKGAPREIGVLLILKSPEVGPMFGIFLNNIFDNPPLLTQSVLHRNQWTSERCKKQQPYFVCCPSGFKSKRCHLYLNSLVIYSTFTQDNTQMLFLFNGCPKLLVQSVEFIKMRMCLEFLYIYT